MRTEGLEPSRGYPLRILSPVCLPIPPRPRYWIVYRSSPILVVPPIPCRAIENAGRAGGKCKQFAPPPRPLPTDHSRGSASGESARLSRSMAEVAATVAIGPRPRIGADAQSTCWRLAPMPSSGGKWPLGSSARACFSAVGQVRERQWPEDRDRARHQRPQAARLNSNCLVPTAGSPAIPSGIAKRW